MSTFTSRTLGTLLIQNKGGDGRHMRDANKWIKYFIQHETKETYSPKAKDADLLGISFSFAVLGL